MSLEFDSAVESADSFELQVLALLKNCFHLLSNTQNHDSYSGGNVAGVDSQYSQYLQYLQYSKLEVGQRWLDSEPLDGSSLTSPPCLSW